MKTTWQLIRSAVSNDNSKSLPISELFVNGIKYTDSLQIANQFNLFFTSAPAEIVNKIPPSPPPEVKFVNPI